MSYAPLPLPNVSLWWRLCPDLVALLALSAVLTFIALAATGRRLPNSRRQTPSPWVRLIRVSTRRQSVVLLSWGIVGATVAASAMLAFVPRYLTLSIPFLYLTLASSWRRISAPQSIQIAVGMFLLAGNIANRDGRWYPDLEARVVREFAEANKLRERSYEYLPFLQADVEAAAVLNQIDASAKIFTASPYGHYLSYPQFGYVDAPRHGYLLGIKDPDVGVFRSIEELVKGAHSDSSIFVRGTFLASHFWFPPLEEGDEVLYQGLRPGSVVVFRKTWRDRPPRDASSMPRWYEQRDWPGVKLVDQVDFRASIMAWTGQTRRAIEDYSAAVEAHPKDAEFHFHFGAFLYLHQKFSQAAPHLLLAAEQRYDHAHLQPFLGDLKHRFQAAEAWLGQARQLLDQGATADAQARLQQALEANPDSTPARVLLAQVALSQAQPAQAVEQLRFAIESVSTDASLHAMLGTALRLLGRNSESADELREAIRLNSSLLTAANELAWLLATSPDSTSATAQEAVDLAERVCHETLSNQAGYLDTLAAAYAAAGRMDDAIRISERAIEIATANDHSIDAGRFHERLLIYRQGGRFIEMQPLESGPGGQAP